MFLALLGCGIVIKEEPSRSSLPTATSIVREADRQGIDPYELLDRYYAARNEEVEDRASRLRARAPDNQKRRYDIELERDLSLLTLEYEARLEQLDRRLSGTGPSP